MKAESSAEFDWWFCASYASIARTVYLVLGERAQAEEITQDTFVKVFENWSKIHSDDRPDAWARRVAVRMAIKPRSGRPYGTSVSESCCARSSDRAGSASP